MTGDAERERKARTREAWKTWMAANPGWRQEFEERNKERLRAQKSEWHKLNRARQRRHATKLERGRAYREANRSHERERSRLFREQHPEKVREFARRYKERHPERAAENARRGTQRYRDRNADAQREAQRVTAAARRAENPDEYRDWYKANLEEQRERGRQASRLRSRLKALGLPPRRIQRIYAEQKRAHAAAADEYFSRKRKVPERRAIGLEAPGAIPKLPPARHASENLPTPTHLLELFARQSAVARLRWMARDELPDLLGAARVRHGMRVRDEVRMDAAASRREEEIDVDAETDRRLRAIAVSAFLQRHRGDAKLAHGLIAGSIVQAQDAAWWAVATPQVVASVLELADTEVAGTPAARSALRTAIERGAVRHHGMLADQFARGQTGPVIHEQVRSPQPATKGIDI